MGRNTLDISREIIQISTKRGGRRNRLTICQIRYKKKTNSETVTLSMSCQSLCHCSLSTFVEVVEGRHQKKVMDLLKLIMDLSNSMYFLPFAKQNQTEV